MPDLSPKLPPRYFHLFFSLLMAGIMVTLVTGVVTWLNVGGQPGFFGKWLHAFLISYCIAAPTLYLLAPYVRRLIARFVSLPEGR